MDNSLKAIDTRNYLWDNMKTFLIFTVVVGHFLETFPVNHIFFEGIDYWIYTFHMPAFLFVSGFWSKGFCKDSKVRSEKVGNFIAYYLIFQLVFYVAINICKYYDGKPLKDFTLLDPNIGLWYLFAMIIYYLLIPFVEKIPPYITLPVFVFLGLTIGCNTDADSFMAMSRTFVFAPFFFTGYYCPQKLIDTLRNIKGRIIIGVALCFASIFIWSYVINEYGNEYLKMSVFYGKSGYKAMGYSDAEGIIMRAIGWAIGLLMLVSLILIFSEKKNALSYMGKNSLQIYIFHFLLIIFFKVTDFTKDYPIDRFWQGTVLCLAGIAFTFLLSLPIRVHPFNWIQKLVSKLFLPLQTKEAKNDQA